jgi:hypothetical protein
MLGAEFTVKTVNRFDRISTNRWMLAISLGTIRCAPEFPSSKSASGHQQQPDGTDGGFSDRGQ